MPNPRVKTLVNLDNPEHNRDFAKCATTGLSADEIVNRVDCADAPDWAKAAAIRICRSYGISGLCDFAYVSNTIRAEYQRFRA